MLKPIILLAAITAIVLFALITIPARARMSQATAPTSTNATTMANPVRPTASSQARARKIYINDCAMCRGENGKTDIATSMQVTLDDWTNPKSLANKSDSVLFDTIRKGAGSGAVVMPAEDPERASDADVWNLVIYIRSMAK